MTTPTDQFDVTATTDKPSYTTGDTVTVTISGEDVHTEQTTLHVTVTVKDPVSKATGTAKVNVPLARVSHDSVVIDSVTDDQSHVWTVAAGGLSASTTA